VRLVEFYQPWKYLGRRKGGFGETSRILPALEMSRKKESGIGMTSRFLLVLETSEELTPAFVRLIEIYQP
jgi:hypothetical protein